MGNAFKQPRGFAEGISAPEFFVTHIGDYEVVEGTQCIRFYVGTQRGNTFCLDYTAIIPLSRISSLAKICNEAAAAVHNELTWQRRSEEEADHH